MQSTYHIAGMTCEACKYKVEHLLKQTIGVSSVSVDLANHTATIESETEVSFEALKQALVQAPKYAIQPSPTLETESKQRSWFETYKPVLLIFFFVTVVSGIAAWQIGHHFWMHWCRLFMAGFFLAFSFFKLLDVKAFAESYSMYDLIAKRIPFYGMVYPFIELSLGILYVLNWQPLMLNAFTFSIMAVSLAGVMESILNNRKIRCACLGAVFNLPMSTVTIIEDGLMIGMAAVMIVYELKLLP